MSTTKRFGWIAMTDHGPVTDGRDALVFASHEEAQDCLRDNPLHPPVRSVVGVIRARRLVKR